MTKVIAEWLKHLMKNISPVRRKKGSENLTSYGGGSWWFCSCGIWRTNYYFSRGWREVSRILWFAYQLSVNRFHSVHTISSPGLFCFVEVIGNNLFIFGHSTYVESQLKWRWKNMDWDFCLLTGSHKSRPTTCKEKKLRSCHNFVLIECVWWLKESVLREILRVLTLNRYTVVFSRGAYANFPWTTHPGTFSHTLVVKVVVLAQPRSQDFSSPRVGPTLAGEKPWERGWVLVLVVGMAVVVVVV